MRRRLRPFACLLAFTALACASSSRPASETDPAPGAASELEYEALAQSRADADATWGQPAGDALTPRDDPSSREGQAVARERPAATIFRDELRRATHDGRPGYLLAQLGPNPVRERGRFVGWEITRVWPGDPDLCAPSCGIRPGDIIVSVNGMRLEQPEALDKLMAQIETAKALEIQRIRDGVAGKVRWDVVDAP